jgi:thiosulfate dehydrogenase (quinone) large subunit
MAHNITLFLLRISLGWYMFYAGITKVFDPNWSAAGYLKGAKLIPEFYTWLTSPGVLPIVNFMNEWGLTLLGVSLILGIFVKYSAPLGALLMLLYYIPLGVIHPDAHSFIVDDHVIYGLLLVYLGIVGAGKVWGLDGRRRV